MKQIFLVIFLFSSVFSFCQRTYKVTEGELQFINPQKGIFVKKENIIYNLDLKNISDYEEISKGFKYKLENTTNEEVEKLKKDNSTIFKSEITKYNFNKFNNTKFITNVKDDDNFQLVKYNNDFISIAILEDSLQKPRNEYLFHYCILDFGNNKKIIYHEEGLIVPTKEKIKFIFENYNMSNAFKTYSTINYETLKANELHLLKSNLELNRDFYKIDTLKNQKLQIKNIYNQIQVNKTFDSISYSSFFIIGYDNKKINIYNYRFQKLNKKDVKAFSFDKFYPNLQILENNKLRTINLIGNDYKNQDLSFHISFDHFFPSNKASLFVTKNENDFYIETDNIYDIVKGINSFENKYKVIDSEKYETIQYLNEQTFITLNSEMLSYTIKYPILMYTKLKNGKYNLNTIDYLINSNLEAKNIEINKSLPKNLDSISLTNENLFLIERNDLFGYYPLNKEVKYKKIENFIENFARFELPNGKKGWLSKDGKEYLDE